MNTVYACEDYLGADEYIDVVKKSGLNRPVEDRGRVERYLKHSNLFVTAQPQPFFCFFCIESGRAAPSCGLPARPGFLSFILAPPGPNPPAPGPLCAHRMIT